MKKTFLLLVMFIPIIGYCFGDKFSDAKDSYTRFTDSYEKIRNLEVKELRKLVESICEADDDSRISIGRSVAERVESDIRSNYEELKRLKEYADEKIKLVLNDQSLNDRWDDVRKFQDRMDEIMGRIERMKDRVRAGNNPVFAEMSRIGMEAHIQYQSINSSNGVAEFPIPGGKIDFINWNTCECIEVKANNSSSISKGRSQVRDYRDYLNNNSDVFKRLLEKSEKFEKCKGKFRATVVCYIYCPEITDNGEIRSASIGWTVCDKD